MINDTETPKRPRGRPKGAKKTAAEKGALIWVGVEYKAAVLAYLEVLKQQRRKSYEL